MFKLKISDRHYISHAECSKMNAECCRMHAEWSRTHSECSRMHAECSRTRMYQNACRSMSLHGGPWACMQLHKLARSYMSLHAVPWAWMQFISSSEQLTRISQCLLVQNLQKPYMFDLGTHSPLICDALWSICHIGGFWAPLKNCFVVLHPCG